MGKKKQKKTVRKPEGHDKCVEILSLIGHRLMFLKIGYGFSRVFGTNKALQIACPDLCDHMAWLISMDAYITVSSFFCNGKYMFASLSGDDPEISKLASDAYAEINRIIPDFDDIRDKVFAHTVKERESEHVNMLLSGFPAVFNVLLDLYEKCCKLLDVDPNNLRGYDASSLDGIDDQIRTFSDIVDAGFTRLHEERYVRVYGLGDPRKEACYVRVQNGDKRSDDNV